ncbi:AAA-ATPase At5g57480-like [Cucurbita pepo subsp. pepo]|uniref:AAA-ATPase At5g57480-like n=1 Tax=Cucurbita pepo subsp. pepo TaxID=3664 RepID=UPI000C9D2B97|nr:AAA-ATPase At5g57480-like [Cucurbita pepo subsp. pepo]
MKEYWSTMASLLGLLAFSQSIFQAIFPPELRFAALKLFTQIFRCFSSYVYLDITEIDGVNTNELYNAVQLYLSSSVSISGNRLSLTRAVNSSAITFGLANNDCIRDSFNGVTVQWEHIVSQRQAQGYLWRPLPEEKRGFTLRIRKQDKPLILDSYLDFVMDRADEIRRKNQERRLFTNSRGGSLDSRGNPWESVPFKHPSTFDTLAMDPLRKQQIMEDLQDFAKGQSFYQQTGRAWKRGYLLYGPPGTGKSSMIAAMANFLGYDIYDLELTEVHNNSELRKLLMKTTSKSIIVIEDIDCSINLTDRKKKNPSSGSRTYFDLPDIRSGGGGYSSISGEKNGAGSITLSGLLNFTDGLWSCCGSERIFVFTTNHIEKLDPALLRSGRMDMHIFMSYCSFSALKILLKNYLNYSEDESDFPVLDEIKEVIDKAKTTPADVSELLIKNRRCKNRALTELLETLKSRAEKNGRELSKKEMGLEEEEEEEQEKRTLDSPKEASEFEEDRSKETEEGDEKDDDNTTRE